ncbi:acetyltransferase [Comamonas terrigena]|uniref:acetyltransferase n=1 Tax=Comamonas terrigena TaxID=32013 RepID=UPI0028A00E17|nr:acetyltransferase [Comamonas terrigena]
MHINTEADFAGTDPATADSKFITLRYRDGSYSLIPVHFFRDWQDNDILGANFGTFEIGRGTGFGVGSLVKYDGNHQSLRVGRYVSGGLRLRFLLNGQHDMTGISTCLFSALGQGLQSLPMPQYGDTVLKNDIWIGDEAMFMGGSCIENGCVIGARTVVPPNFKTEAYGIYAGSPARLIRFRFPEKVREALQELAWWELPLAWVKEHNNAFLMRIAEMDEGQVLEALQELQASKNRLLSAA